MENLNPKYSVREVDGSYTVHCTEPSANGGETSECILTISDLTACLRSARMPAPLAYRVSRLLNLTTGISDDDIQHNCFVLASGHQKLKDELLSVERRISELAQWKVKMCDALGVKSYSSDAALSAAQDLKHKDDLANMAASARLEMAEIVDLSDREKDLLDTNNSLRLALKVISNKFGVSSSDPQLVVASAIKAHETLQGQMEVIRNSLYLKHDATIGDYTNKIDLLDRDGKAIVDMRNTLQCNASNCAPEEVAVTVKNLQIRCDSLTKENRNLQNEKDNDQSNAEARRIAQMLNRNVREMLDLPAGTIPSVVLSTITGLIDFKKEIYNTFRIPESTHSRVVYDSVRQLCAGNIPETIGQLRTELHIAEQRSLAVREPLQAIGTMLWLEKKEPVDIAKELIPIIQDYSNTAKEYSRMSAAGTTDKSFIARMMAFVELDCSVDARNISLTELGDRVINKVNGLNQPIMYLANQLEIEETEPVNIIQEIRNAFTAQTEQLEAARSLASAAIAERNEDRSIIGAVDDICGDKSRPAVPVLAAIRELVKVHITNKF